MKEYLKNISCEIHNNGVVIGKSFKNIINKLTGANKEQ